MKNTDELKGKLVCCLIEGMGLVVGKFNNEGELTLKNPRVVQIQQAQAPNPNAPPQAQLRLVEMVGSPDRLIMNRQPVIIYEIMKKEIKDLYVQSTTNLVVTNKMPNLEIVK